MVIRHVDATITKYSRCINSIVIYSCRMLFFLHPFMLLLQQHPSVLDFTTTVPTISTITTNTVSSSSTFVTAFQHNQPFFGMKNHFLSSPKKFSPFLITSESFLWNQQHHQQQKQPEKMNLFVRQASTSSNVNDFTTKPTTSVKLQKNEQKRDGSSNNNIVYKDLMIPLTGEYSSINVPVACWFPFLDNNNDHNENNNDNDNDNNTNKNKKDRENDDDVVTYQYRISIRKIGQLLAGWEFVPSFVAKDYNLIPTYQNEYSIKNGGRSFTMYPSLVSTVSTTTTTNNNDDPTTTTTTTKQRKPKGIILLAHGYLGSRFDLSHLAETLAVMGYICFAPEYPESLSASYESTIKTVPDQQPETTTISKKVDRQMINEQLLYHIHDVWKITSSTTTNDISSNKNDENQLQFGIIGHSLGTGTVLKTGDDSWIRICIAGFPPRQEQQDQQQVQDQQKIFKTVLYITSLNDSLAKRYGTEIYQQNNIPYLNEQSILNSIQEQQQQQQQEMKEDHNNKKNDETSGTLIPTPSVLIYGLNDITSTTTTSSMTTTDITTTTTKSPPPPPPPPNHISYLTESVNDSMIDFLSPLLPIARTLNIPVLDFDVYQTSRDSKQTAERLHPIILQYLTEQTELKQQQYQQQQQNRR